MSTKPIETKCDRCRLATTEKAGFCAFIGVGGPTLDCCSSCSASVREFIKAGLPLQQAQAVRVELPMAHVRGPSRLMLISLLISGVFSIVLTGTLLIREKLLHDSSEAAFNECAQHVYAIVNALPH